MNVFRKEVFNFYENEPAVLLSKLSAVTINVIVYFASWVEEETKRACGVIILYLHMR